MTAKHTTYKKDTVKKVFNDVFDKYDLMNDCMSLGIHRVWKKIYINSLNPQKNSKLIDVASGTGDIAKLFLKKVSYNGAVCCVDENKEMLKLNKKKNKETQNIKFFQNRAERLPFPNNYFDYYSISFGIRNVENIDQVLSEAYRVLKPGGKFMCLEFSKVENEIFKKFYKFYSNIIPKIGKVIVGDSSPYEYLVQSIKEFYTQEELNKKIMDHKFENSTYKNLSFGIVAIHSAWKI